MSVLGESPSVVVIGGANVDIQGRVSSRALGGESNPGRVTRSAGGVGRNIAHGLARMGVSTTLITALGGDDDGRWLARTTEESGVDLGHAVWSSHPTATYLAVLDEEGELVVAVNDMAVIEELDSATIDVRATVIEQADAVVLDCNLPESTIAAVAALGRPLFVDPVSAVKGPRVVGFLDRVHTIKPNRAELGALTGMSVSTDESIETAARSLIDRGVQRVVVSLGADGVMAVEGERTVVVPPRAPVESDGSVTGAGDALLAGVVAAHVRGHDTSDAIDVGLDAVAAATGAAGATGD